jgi:ribose transport system permease protein
MRDTLTRTWFVRRPTVLVLALVIIGSAIAEPQFLTAGNLFNLLRQIAPNCIVATGMAIVMIAGGIDLSVGAMLSLAGVIAIASQPSFGYPLGIIFALTAGVVAGLANGLLVSRLRIIESVFGLAARRTKASRSANWSGRVGEAKTNWTKPPAPS